jgi:hypothetical protein
MRNDATQRLETDGWIVAGAEQAAQWHLRELQRVRLDT